jgi:hypothetical protein
MVIPQLHYTRSVNLEEGVAAVRLCVGDAVGFLLDIDAEALRNIFADKAMAESRKAQKDRDGDDEQDGSDQNQRANSFDRESHVSVPQPQARGEALGETFTEFAPQQASGCARFLFDSLGEGDELSDVLFDVTRGLRIQINVLF